MEGSPQQRISVPALIAGGGALVVFLCLMFVATSPRASLYALQAVTSVLLILVVLRFLKARVGAGVESTRNLRPPWELWAALPLGVGVFVWIFPLYFVGEDFWLLHMSRQPVLEVLGEVLGHGYGGGYLRLVAAATFALDYRLWQIWPPGYHLTNLLLFISAVVGVYAVGRSLGLERRESGTAALLFSCLPIHAVTLARVAARDELLATPLMLWAVVLYVRFRGQGHWAGYWAAFVLFLVAVFSKENAFVFPALLIALELLLLPNRRFRPAAGFILAGLLAFVYRWLALGGIGADRAQAYLSNIGLQSLLTLGVWVPTQTLFGLNWVQPPRMEAVLLASLAAGLLGGLALGAKLHRSAWRWAGFWGLWMIMSALPIHFLLSLRPDLRGYHRMYLGSVGLCFLLAHWLERFQPARLRAAWTFLIVVVFSAGVLHNLRAHHFASALSEKVNAELLRLEPSPPPGTVFVFHGLPGNIRGVTFAGSHRAGRVQFAYGRDDLEMRRVPRRSSGSLASRWQVHFRWTGDPERLLERIADPTAARPVVPRPGEPPPP